MVTHYAAMSHRPRQLNDTYLYASDYGVREQSADNSDALRDCATALQRSTGRAIVRLPHGTIKGHLPMAQGVVWEMGGTTLTFPDSGPTGHLVTPLEWSYWGDLNGSGAHRSGIVGMGLIDGRAQEWGIKPLPKAPKPSVAGASGTLASGYYAWRIAFARPGYGPAMPSSQVTHTLSADGGVALSWTIPTGAEDAEVWIYGRSATTMWGQLILARLPAGTTTWTDDGSITPTTEPVRWLDVSAPSNVVVGATWDIDGLTIDNMPGTGLVTRFDADTPDGAARAQMEGVARSLRIRRSGAEGVGFCGPHDSVFRDMFISDSGRTSLSDTSPTRTHFMVADSGPCIIQNSHMWGYSKWCVEALYRTEIHNSQLEGGSAGMVNVQYDTRISDSEMFFPLSSSSVGVRVGESWWKPVVHIEACRFRDFDADSGVALDLRNAAPGSRVRAQVNQDTGTVLAGGEQCDIELSVVGDASAQSIRPRSDVATPAYGPTTVPTDVIEGDLVLDTPNEIVSGKHVKGRVVLYANATNVVIEDCVVEGSQSETEQQNTGTQACITPRYMSGSLQGATIRRCRIDNKGMGGATLNGLTHGNAIVERCEITGVADGISLVDAGGNLTVRNCWIHDGPYDYATVHGDGVQFHRGKDVLIENCRIDGWSNAGMMIKQETDSSAELKIERVTIKNCHFGRTVSAINAITDNGNDLASVTVTGCTWDTATTDNGLVLNSTAVVASNNFGI